MKTIATFGLLILVASMVVGGMTSNVSAQDDPTILLKIAKRAQEQINNHISSDPSDKIQGLFEEGKQKVTLLEEALENNNVASAKEYFLSTMEIFTKISKQLETSDVTHTTETVSVNNIQNLSNDLQRIQAYVDNLKIIAQKHNTSIDFSDLDELFILAEQQINDNQYTLASKTIHEIKDTARETKKELREEASKQESHRAKAYAQKYLEQLDRLIEHAKKQGIADEIVEKLEASKENLSTAENPTEIIQEIRKIKSIKDKFELTKNDELESRVLKIEKTMTLLSQIDEINQDDLTDAQSVLENIKHHLNEGEFEIAKELLKNLTRQLQDIKNSL